MAHSLRAIRFASATAVTMRGGTDHGHRANDQSPSKVALAHLLWSAQPGFASR